MATPAFTFEQFQKTRRYLTGQEFINAIGDRRWDDTVDEVGGYIYLGCLHIECTDLWTSKSTDILPPPGRWSLMLDRSDWCTDDLEALEQNMYEWALGEGFTLDEVTDCACGHERHKHNGGFGGCCDCDPCKSYRPLCVHCDEFHPRGEFCEEHLALLRK